MMALIYSYLFVFAILGISTLLNNLNIINDEGSRKFIHIGVGNWIILAYLLFDNTLLALIPPFSFIILNWLSYRFNLVKAMERDVKSKNDLGTVYYAISLFVLVLADYLVFDTIKLAILPILLMAYGDGLCAIVGSNFKSRLLVAKKSVLGTLTMFLVSVILVVIMGYGFFAILIIPVAATLIELYSPKGYDNLTVPILVYLFLLSGLVI